MDNFLPTEFDLIVVGTGLTESIVSAAASRIGKSVLHIDKKNFYGGIWASFNLESIQKFNDDSDINKIDCEVELVANERKITIGNTLFEIKDFKQNWHIPIDIETTQEIAVVNSSEEDEIVWTQKKLLENSRKFNIDIAPKINFSRGDFVELLISSNIARYSEFRSVTRILTYINGELQSVPSSRSDIFANSKVSVIDKRLLMKLLTTCMESNGQEFYGYENKTFKNYLTDNKLNRNLIHYVLYAIAMCNDKTLCLDGVKKTKRFLTSLGRFGKTPFLYSMYGSGEIPQAFCRMSAVFGGIYALNQPLGGFLIDSQNKFTGIIAGKQKIYCKHLVMSIENASMDYITTTGELSYISRAIFIIDRSILNAAQESLTLLLFPTEDGQDICHVIEAGSSTGTCPKGVYMLYMYMKQRKDAEADLKYFVEKLLSNGDDVDKPKMLWSFYYSVPNIDIVCSSESNAYFCPGPDLDLDYDETIKKSRTIFEDMYPGEVLLPRAPDPEDIIIGDDDENKEDLQEVCKETVESDNVYSSS